MLRTIMDFNFKPRMFFLMLLVCGLLSGFVAWVTELNFVMIFLICIAAVLLNGVVASIEDRNDV